MNNVYYNIGCPAIKHTQVNLTNYLPLRSFDQQIKKNNYINTIQEYKLFLQNNAELLMNRERENLISYNTCNYKNRICDICSDNRDIK